MEIQDRIKERRKALGLTLKDVAKALGVSEGTVSRYESADIQNMGVNKLVPLARVLQCSPVDLLMGWEDSPEGTAASGSDSSSGSVSSIDPRKDRLNVYFDRMDNEGRDQLVLRAEELIKLGHTLDGDDEVSRSSFIPSDGEAIA